MSGLAIARDDPARADVAALVALHVAASRGSTPAANAHVLDAAGLADPRVTFYTARGPEGTLAGMAALRMLEPGHAELKSMRTAPAFLRRGVARALLSYLLAEARARDCTRLSLETGTVAMFAPANALYEAAGFRDCGTFGGYPASAYNRFMTLRLD